MKKFLQNILIFSLMAFNICNCVYADNISDAEALLKKAKIASIQDEAYEYINKARDLYLKEYEKNPTNIDVLLGLSKVNQLTGDRAEAKLYVLKAYNMNPASPKLQCAMGDFFYSFQEYSTAIEYYKLALASGLLEDYETNLKTAKCYEKLGDLENAELYYKICAHVNSSSKEAKNKINEYVSSHKPDDTQELDDLKYKYLFKKRVLSEDEETEQEARDIIQKLSEDLIP